MKHRATVMLVLAFALCAPLVTAQNTLETAKNPAVWTINGDPIYAAEISMTMQNLAAQIQQAGGPAPTSEELMQAATQRMIEQKLLAQEAKRLSIRNNEQRLAETIAQMEQQAGGKENLESLLTQGGSNYAQVISLLKERDLVMQLVDTRIAPTIKIGEEDITAYYNENPVLFTSDEEVTARHIIFEVPEGAPEEQASAARAKADEAHKRAVAGEDFATLAKELSEGPSASVGGDLGQFSTDRMVKPFSEALSTLEEGEISGVVRTPFGYHVIKMGKIIPAGKRGLEDVHDKIATVLQQEKVGETLSGLVESLRKSGTIEPVMPSGATSLDGLK